MSLDPELRKTVRETFELEMAVNGGQTYPALESAIEAVLETYRRTVVDGIAVQAESYAAVLDAEMEPPEGETTPEAAALGYFAHMLRKAEPPTFKYDPQYLDIVSITIAGEVSLADDGGFVVLDDMTGFEYWFSTEPEEAPRVQVLSRAREELGA